MRFERRPRRVPPVSAHEEAPTPAAELAIILLPGTFSRPSESGRSKREGIRALWSRPSRKRSS
jgi:hypothetical protein